MLLLCTALIALPAAAQTRDCLAERLLSVDGLSFGTQAIPRNPQDPASREQNTVSISLRNLTGQRLTFVAGFTGPPVQRSFVAGQVQEIAGGVRRTRMLGNVLNGAANPSFVQNALRLTCY